jgi:phage repressor protein C with HTH and peptisase S24 domain
MSNAKSVTERNGYSADELAKLKLPGYPTSRKGWYDRARRDNWEIREEPGKGPGGTRQVFVPPPKVLELIESIKHSERMFFGSEQPKEKAVREKAAPEYVPAPDGFILVPHYEVHASAGNGTLVHSEQIVDYLAFKADWVRNTLGVTQKDLALISVKGDSMEPVLSNEDLILIDMRKNRVEDNAIYVLQLVGSLLVKRIQRKLDGSLHVMSDNPRYEAEIVNAERAPELHVLGRVVWSGRRM